MADYEQVLQARIRQLEEENRKLRELIGRIIVGYHGAVCPNDCPPAPHACDKCEIYFLLDEYQTGEPQQ